MPERIYKLQPDRTLHLRGFDSFAAAAAIHSASPTGFTVSGTFRDPADFTVAVLYDADNFFEHPRIKYLPDFDFSGLTLSFDLHYTAGLQPVDSPKYNWIDWATLDCVRPDGSIAYIPLWENATLNGASFPAAQATVTVTTSGQVHAFDKVSLWYQNLAFEYTAPAGSLTAGFDFFASGTGTTHSITVNGRTYSRIESDPLGESSAHQAEELAGAMLGDPDVTASASGNTVTLSIRAGREGVDIPVSASDGNGPATLRLTTPEIAAAGLAALINATNWTAAGTPYALLATSSEASVTVTAARYGRVNVSGTAVTRFDGHVFTGIAPGSTILIAEAPGTVATVESPTHLTLAAPPGDATAAAYVAPRGGREGNLIELYSLSTSSTLALDQTNITLTGGSSDVTWRCTLDFTALGIDQIRQCWLTFAPSLVVGAYPATEWQATFSNWTLTGDEDKKSLKVAGPGSVRVDSASTACQYSPAHSWNDEAGFYSKYFARATSDTAATATISYSCQFEHDLWIGASLYGTSVPAAGLTAVASAAGPFYSDRAVASIRLDNDPTTDSPLDTRLNTGSALITRRRVRASVPAGRHTVTITIDHPGVFYFDYLEAAVPSDVPDAFTPRANVSPALDFDTDHTYKLSPSRLHWIFDRLGYAGPMNEYLGVFWWNERTLAGGSLSIAQIEFNGTYTADDLLSITLSGATMRKSVFAADTPATIARHFAAFINGASVGAWASASGSTLTITSRSPAPAYNVTLTTPPDGVEITTAPAPGVYGTWIVDTAANPSINRATRDWHADFYAQCAARGREVTTAVSMELVNPPDAFTARFPDEARTPVSTATGFGSLSSNHCAIGSSGMIAYQKSVYRNLAALQSAAGLTPNLQFGEFLWWFFPGPGGMAFYDDETLAAWGSPLPIFTSPDDDPSDPAALFLRNRLRDHIAALVTDIRSAYPTAKLELLWPYDVNHDSPVQITPTGTLGGRLNRFINLPAEWQDKATSGLDRIKIEALAFAATARNLNLANEAIHLFPGFGWPLDSLRYLVPVFGSATPWHRELALARAAGFQINNFWAFDHFCLYNLDVPEPTLERRSVVLAA